MGIDPHESETPPAGFEVEVKYRVDDPSSLAARLGGILGGAGAAVEQYDVYLAHPCRDFARTGEAFRIRRSGSEVLLTYKGPKHPGPTKTREEIEVGLAGGVAAIEATRALVDRLGFREVAAVAKRRRTVPIEREGRSLTLAIDEVDGIGHFVEVEGLAGSAVELEATQSAVLGLAAELGLDRVEPRSYLRMQLERATRSTDPTGRS